MLRSVVLFLILYALAVNAQDTEYSSPLNIPLLLSGNFCELRSDHFHSGIDIKTEGHEGLPVFAVEDGYISRVKVSAVGYGKAIYITHPNNKVTVYAHLHSFTGILADSVEALQYSRKSFEVELFPDKKLFPVKRNQQIAWSGNSGGSESPHLHFEIRDEKSEEPLNPLLNGWKIEDSVNPVINSLVLYSYRGGLFLLDTIIDFNHENKKRHFNDSIFINADTVALAFSAVDSMNDLKPSSLGIYSAVLLNGADTIYQYAFNRMNFNESRNVNAHVDYELLKSSQMESERCYTVSGNKFKVFGKAGPGFIPLKPDSVTKITLVVSDANGNASKKLFCIKNERTIKKAKMVHKEDIIYYPNKQFMLKSNGVTISFPEEAFFENIKRVSLKVIAAKDHKFSIFHIEPDGIAMKKMYSIKIDVPNRLLTLKEKLLIVKISKHGEITSIGGEFADGMIATNSWSFGGFSLAVDTVPPLISDCQLASDTIFNCRKLSIHLEDKLSGIKSYEGKINGQWALFEYDVKNNSIIYWLKEGEHHMDVEINSSDKKGNRTNFRKTINN